MNDRSLDNEGFEVVGLVFDSSSVTVKKAWQSPQLTEMDYSETSDGLAGSGDLGGKALS